MALNYLLNRAKGRIAEAMNQSQISSTVTNQKENKLHHRGNRAHRGKTFLVYSSLCPLCSLWLKTHYEQLIGQTA
jgi:hypothetical protein